MQRSTEVLESWFARLDAVGKTSQGGFTRLAYTVEEDRMHETARQFALEEGFATEEDAYGNTYFSVEPGLDCPYILIGSHLDSVPDGGRYDGIAGVLAGLLIMRWLKQEDIHLPVKTAAFRCEESSGFGRATLGSSMATGKIAEKDLKALKNKQGEILLDVMKGRGLLQSTDRLDGVIRYLELHIEQGRRLYEQKTGIGIVNSIAAPSRYEITISGRQDHSGATPMDMRQDALCGAADLVLAIEKIGNFERGYSTVATVGILNNSPNVMNVIPGECVLGVDIRGIDPDSIARAVSQMEDVLKGISEKRNLRCRSRMISSERPVAMDAAIQKQLEQAAEKLGYPYLNMPSGAGHDAMEMADLCPCGMVFVPCVEGISHNPREEASIADIVRGARVLYEAIIAQTEPIQ